MSKNKGGRPSGYQGEPTLKKAKKYLEQAKDRIREDENGKLILLEANIPKVAGLALYLGFGKSTIYRWAEDYPEFQEILDMINATQEERVINYAASGLYNSNIAKLLLGKHGYAEKQQMEDVTPPAKKAEENVETYKRLQKLGIMLEKPNE